jgi:hypothetical protein
MQGIRFRGGRLIQFMALLALAALVPGWQQACAQNVAPLELTFVLRGGPMYNYVNGMGWKGITGDKIDAGYPWMEKWPAFFTRANIRVVCTERCPDTLNRYGQSPQDKVVWKEGPPTVGGRIEVRCGEYHYCAVYQDDKRVHPNADYRGDWHQVSYVELAAPAKP